MVWPLLCSTLGLAVLFLLFFFLPEGWPGWLVGLLVAFGCSVGAVLLAISRSPGTGLAFLLAQLALAPLTASVAGRLRRRFDPAPSRDEFTLRDESLHTLIGRRGRALTPLRPAGSVDFDGRRLDGLSEGAYIDEDTPVTGIRVRGRFLVVRAYPDPFPSRFEG
jgi:membrane-bound ClpP family serine protease